MFFHVILRLLYFSSSIIVITQSGQMVAQNAQPIHFSCSVTVAGWNPFALILSSDICTIFFGQTVVQSLHPLHLSSLKITFGTLTAFFQIYISSKLLLKFQS